MAFRYLSLMSAVVCLLASQAHQRLSSSCGKLLSEPVPKASNPPSPQFIDIRLNEASPFSVHLSTNFIGQKVATFSANEYHASFEPELRKLHVELVVIEKPSATDLIHFRPEAGYHAKPQKIVWRRHVQSRADYENSLNSKGRSNFRNHLKKSESIGAKVSGLSEDDFAEWYALYEREVVERERGRRVMTPDWFSSKRARGELDQYRKFFFRDPQSGELLGGAIVHFHKNNQVATIAYAAYAQDARDKQLGIRTFAEVMEWARKSGCAEISYGQDTNFYGQHLSVGLMTYKASLGFQPRVATEGAREIVKVLDATKLGAEYFFFAEDDSGNLVGRHFYDGARRLTVPQGVQLERRPLNSPSESPTTRPTENQLLVPAYTLAQAKALAELYASISGQELRHILPESAESSPRLTLLAIVEQFQRGQASLEFFVREASRRQLLLPVPPEEPLPAATQSPDFSGKLATFAAKRVLRFWWIPYLRRWSMGHFGNAEAIEKANLSMDGSQEIADFLANVRLQFGAVAHDKAVRHILLLLSPLDVSAIALQPVTRALPPSHHLTLDDIPFRRLFSEEDQQSSRVLFRELTQRLAEASVDNGRQFGLMFHGTVGGATLATARRLIEGDETRLQVGQLRRTQRIVEIIHELRRRKREDPKWVADPHAARFAADLGPLTDQLPALQFAIASANVDWRHFDYFGRTSEEVLFEFFQRASSAQRLRLAQTVQADYPQSQQVEAQISALARAFVSEPANALPLPPLPTKALAEACDALASAFFAVEFNQFRKLVAFTATHFNFTPTPTFLDNRNSARHFVLTYFAQHGRLPDFAANTLKELVRQFLRIRGAASLQLEYLAEHPGENVDETTLNTLLEQFATEGSELSKRPYFPMLTLIIRALSNPATQRAAETALQAIELPHGDYRKNAPHRIFNLGISMPAESLAVLEHSMRRWLEAQHRIHSPLGGSNLEIYLACFRLATELGISTDGFWDSVEMLSHEEPYLTSLVLENLDRKVLNGTPNSNLPAATIGRVVNNLRDEPGLRSVAIPDFIARMPLKPYLNASSPGFAKWVQRRHELGGFSSAERMQLVINALAYCRTRVTFDHAALNVLSVLQGPLRPELRARAIRELALTLQTAPFAQTDIYPQLMALYDRLDALNPGEFASGTLGTKTFIAEHPWKSYGYSDAVVAKVQAFASDESFTPRQAELLTNLLLSYDGKDSNRLWVTQLLLATPDKGFHQLVRFLQYWRSLGQPHRNAYLADRVDVLLADARIRALKDAQGAPFEAATAQVRELESKNVPVSPMLRARVVRFQNYRHLALAVAAASDPETKRAARDALNAQILIDTPLKMRPEDEISELIRHQTESFQAKLNFNDEDNSAILHFFVEHVEALSSSGIYDRLVQFSGFADVNGIDRLRTLLRRYADPKQTRLVSIVRPDLAGRATQHFDHFGKFRALETILTARGVAESQRKTFLERWQPLWHFERIAESDATFFSVTHDLERWAKHGEEPRLSCQRWSSLSSPMHHDNWNYQFGAVPNADGRPLARPLLPQLKLAEWRVHGKVVGRATLEVTTAATGAQTRLAMLVERGYWTKGREEEAAFRAAVIRYAAQLGINDWDVHFAEDTEAPEPLPEEFRIYRDTFGALAPH